jgi:hypothetical protein
VTLQPVYPEDHRPAANQFSLRGMFLFTTATCVILAVLALLIKSPMHWLGVLVVPLCCLIIIATMELAGRTSPPHLNEPFSYPPPPRNALQTAYFSDETNRFGLPATTGDSPHRQAITHGLYGKIDATAETKSEPHDLADG